VFGISRRACNNHTDHIAAAAAAGAAGVQLVANNTPTGAGGAAGDELEAGAPAEGKSLHYMSYLTCYVSVTYRSIEEPSVHPGT
jgi:hypothetical protein